MKNVYDAVARTNRRGFATVRLPAAYFAALNRDFRYQLTPVGRQAWDARAGIWQEIRANRFVIPPSRARRSRGRSPGSARTATPTHTGSRSRSRRQMAFVSRGRRGAEAAAQMSS